MTRSNGISRIFGFLGRAALLCAFFLALPSAAMAVDMSARVAETGLPAANPLQRLMGVKSQGRERPTEPVQSNSSANKAANSSPLYSALRNAQTEANQRSLQGYSVNVSYAGQSKSSMAYRNQYRPAAAAPARPAVRVASTASSQQATLPSGNVPAAQAAPSIIRTETQAPVRISVPAAAAPVIAAPAPVPRPPAQVQMPSPQISQPAVRPAVVQRVHTDAP